MPQLRTLALLQCIAALSLQAQTAPVPATPIIPASTSPLPSKPLLAPEAAESPEILVPASDNTFLYTLSLQSQAEPILSEIKAGQLAGSDHASAEVVPTVTAEAPTKTANGWSIPLKLAGLLPFGTSTVPLYYQNKKIETIRILKSGISIEPLTAAQQQSDPLLLVLRNPSSFRYASVRARLRFQGKDVCTFSVEHFPHQGATSVASAAPATQKPAEQASMPSKTGTSDTKAVDECNEVVGWSEFQIPRYSGVSLRAFPLPAEWFNAPDGYSHAVPQKGTLTLRFAGDTAVTSSLEEQVIPVEVNFQAGTVSRSLGYVRVGLWLLVGALCSLGLRVAIPNYRRLRSLDDQLDATRKTIRGVSDEVDSMLRVQLNVECMALATLSRSVLFISPGFTDVAQRADTAIATLRRRIDYVRRLDAALNRRHLLISDELAQPTRIAAIDRSLHTASEELKSDQFREQDWVFIQQSLEAADKVLVSPSEEDKSTFETVLIQRWKSISNQYGFVPDKGWLDIPDSLMPMEICFPSPDALCPKAFLLDNPANPAAAKEADASQWIKTAGTVRADLQLTALELIREFQFLAPGNITGHWGEAMQTLIPWLATPAFEHLNSARSLLRQLSEGISPENIVAALQRGEAHIELDPQEVGFGERVHLAVRFWQANWNSAAARQEIVCEWRFKAVHGKSQSGTPEVKRERSDSSLLPPVPTPETEAPAQTLFYREKGWEINHYFPQASGRSPLEVVFYFNGKPVPAQPGSTLPLIYPFVIDLKSEKKKQIYWEQAKRVAFESIELFAALLVPLCALAVSTADKGSSSQWWQLVGLGFGSDTIRNVLSGTSDSKTPKPS